MAAIPNIQSHLQRTAKPWASLLVMPPKTSASGLVKSPEGFLVRVVHGIKCKTPEGTLREFSRALEFPDYCGCDWDALEECLTDLAWLPAKGYVILITDAQAVMPDHVEEYETLLEILNDVGEAWSKGQTSSGRRAPFHTFFGVSRQNKAKRKHWGLEELPLAGPKSVPPTSGHPPASSQSPRKQRP
jgi:RNAse (barnase) inhibitor barstar